MFANFECTLILWYCIYKLYWMLNYFIVRNKCRPYTYWFNYWFKAFSRAYSPIKGPMFIDLLNFFLGLWNMHTAYYFKFSRFIQGHMFILFDKFSKSYVYLLGSICLFLLPNFPAPTFIPCPKSGLGTMEFRWVWNLTLNESGLQILNFVK